MYCPHKIPDDPPKAFLDAEASKKRTAELSPDKAEPLFAMDKDYTFKNPGRRTDKGFRDVGNHVAKHGDAAFAKLHGINGRFAFSDISTICFTESFPPCSMHLFFENVLPNVTRHFRGKGFKSSTVDGNAHLSSSEESDEISDESSGNEDNDSDHVPTFLNQTKSSKRKRSSHAKKAAKTSKRGSKKQKKMDAQSKVVAEERRYKKKNYIENEDPYNIKPRSWKRIGKEANNSNKTIPSSFSDTIRNVECFINKLKAANWKLWTLSQSPIHYLGELKEPHYSEYINLVKAIRLSVKYSLTAKEVSEIRNRFFRFTAWYEKNVYRYEFKRLSACLPSIHQLRHVADCIEEVGPMYVYSQWTCERACGMMARSAKSMVKPNENMAINLEVSEKLNILEFIMPEYAKSHYEVRDFVDKDGQLEVSDLLSKWHRVSSGLEEPVFHFGNDLLFEPEEEGLIESTDHVLTDVVTYTNRPINQKRWYAPIGQMRILMDFLDEEQYFHFKIPRQRSAADFDDDEQIQFEDEYFRKFTKSLSKWRALKVQSILRLDRHFVINVRETRITSSEVTTQNKKRASWFIQYEVDDEQLKLRNLPPGTPRIFVGEVIFFVQLKIPEIMDTVDNAFAFVPHPQLEGKFLSEEVQLAYIKEMPLEAIRIGDHLDEEITRRAKISKRTLASPQGLYLLKTTDLVPSRRWFVDCRSIVGLVGLIRAQQGEFVVWKDQGCIRRIGEHFEFVEDPYFD